MFGGDACDKGPGSIRLCTCLVDLKQRHPGRVTLLIGNRDGNKMRLTSELHADEIAAVKELPGPYWVNEKRRVSPYQFLLKTASADLGVELTELSDELLDKYNTKVGWLFHKT